CVRHENYGSSYEAMDYW
nr:immunoglobulin heavy chain junction region [Mus musculus]